MTFNDKLLCMKYQMLHPGTTAFYRRLNASQNMSQDELRALQCKKLRRLLFHAWENTDFYRRRFDAAGLHPMDIDGPEDLSALPVLTRQDIRENLSAITSRRVPARFKKMSTTGGTTGTPVRTLLDRRVPHAALGWRMLSWWGYGPSTNMGIIWREASSSFRKRVLNRAISWPSRQVKLNASAITSQAMEQFIQRFQRLDTPVLHGYVGAVHHLARYLDQRRAAPLRPSLVWVTCAPLSEPHRQLLERVFQAPVLDQYGSCEVYWIAAQCPSSGRNLHLFADARLVEVVDSRFNPLPMGESGQLLVTDLENMAFPIIRYAIGDRGHMLSKRCECGMGLPLMGPIQGKSVDTIRLPDGTAITDINVIFDDFPEAVSAFQVHQSRTGDLEIRYIPGNESEITLRAVKTVRSRIQAAVRNQVPVTLKAVDQIPHRGGKLQYVFSEFPQA